MRIPHPIKRDYELVHSSLFGPENSVFYRGQIKNSSTAELPPYWEELVDERTITVHFTPIGSDQRVVVKRIGQNRIWFQNMNGLPINGYFLAIGERRDVPKLQVDQPT